MSCLIGHGHLEIVQTITEHATNLDHLFKSMISPPIINLAKKLTGLLSKGLDKAMFLSTGGESNEAATNIAKCFTGKWEMVGLAASWHGMAAGALSAQCHSGRKGHGPSGRNSIPVFNDTPHFVIPYRFFDTSAVSV
jgi:4-aminobutyrate aminotransferase-like enzyme